MLVLDDQSYNTLMISKLTFFWGGNFRFNHPFNYLFYDLFKYLLELNSR